MITRLKQLKPNMVDQPAVAVFFAPNLPKNHLLELHSFSGHQFEKTTQPKNHPWELVYLPTSFWCTVPLIDEIIILKTSMF